MPPEFKLKIALIGACFYLPVSDFEKKSDTFIEKLGIGYEITQHFVLMRDSKDLSGQTEFTAQKWRVFNGSALDFSAYSAPNISSSADIYIYFNDTLFIKHPWKLLVNRISKIQSALKTSNFPTGLGVIHPTTLFLMKDENNPYRRHMQTFCFALNQSAQNEFIKILKTIPVDSSTEMRDWIRKKIIKYPVLAKMLHFHLFSSNNPWSWQPLNSSSRDENKESLLLKKAISVALEYELSATIINENGIILPLNWDDKYKLHMKLANFCSKFRGTISN